MNYLSVLFSKQSDSTMKQRIVCIHPNDNVLVALADLTKGENLFFENENIILTEALPAKHKFALQPFKAGDEIYMYGVLVGKAQQDIPKGGMITTFNVKHAASTFKTGERHTEWNHPDVSKWKNKTLIRE